MLCRWRVAATPPSAQTSKLPFLRINSFNAWRQRGILVCMKAFLSTLAISGIFAWFCNAQDNLSGAVKPSASDNGSSASPSVDPAAYYATLNLRVVEFRAQSALLSQLAQERTKRAAETSRDQDARAQWDRELAKELEDKSLSLVGLLNNTRGEQLAFEQTHPDLVASVAANSVG